MSNDSRTFVVTDEEAFACGAFIDLHARGCSIEFHGRPIDRITGRAAEHLPDKCSFTDWIQSLLPYAKDTACPGEGLDYMFEIRCPDTPRLYLVTNAKQAWTLMLPSDY